MVLIIGALTSEGIYRGKMVGALLVLAAVWVLCIVLFAKEYKKKHKASVVKSIKYGIYKTYKL